MLASLFLVLGLGIEIEGPDGKVHAPNCVIGIVGKDLEITVRLTKSAPNQKLTIVGGDKKGQEITTDSDGKANANIVIPSPKRIALKTILFQKTNPLHSPVAFKLSQNKLHAHSLDHHFETL